MRQKLRTIQRTMERIILGIPKRDRKTCAWIQKQTKMVDVIERIKKLKWIWAEHVAGRNDDRWTKILAEWKPRDKRRPKRRPYQRWEGEIINLGAIISENGTITENADNRIRASKIVITDLHRITWNKN